MRKTSKTRRAALWLFALLFLGSCAAKDDTDVIRHLIQNGAKLAEEHDIAGLMQLTTENFSALPGEHNRRAVRRILWLAFNHYGQFKVVYPTPTIDLAAENSSASAKFYFLIVRKDQSYPNLKELYQDPQGWLEELGGNADLYRLTLELGKNDGEWLVSEARLDPYRGLGFDG